MKNIFKFTSKNSFKLFGLDDYFILLKNLYIKDKLPKVLMLSGNKGSGKATIITHLMYYIFDNQNYNLINNEYNGNGKFYKQFKNDTFPNIIYLSGSEYINTKIEDIRKLKTQILQTIVSDKPRFIIFDDIELFNNNSLNGLLRIIEEPSKINYFILINNKTKSLIDTIRSRCLDIKVILNEKKRVQITNFLIKKLQIKLILDVKKNQLSPGYFVIFNNILNDNDIYPDGDYLKNLSALLDLYKDNKNQMFVELILFLTDDFFKNYEKNEFMDKNKIIENKRFVFENIHKFFIYNLNKKTFLNNISNIIKNE